MASLTLQDSELIMRECAEWIELFHAICDMGLVRGSVKVGQGSRWLIRLLFTKLST